jgi:putative Mn2+ efflux pump MntP
MEEKIADGYYRTFFIAVGLSMDAFAVAICKGLATKELKIQISGVTGLFFSEDSRL